MADLVINFASKFGQWITWSNQWATRWMYIKNFVKIQNLNISYLERKKKLFTWIIWTSSRHKLWSVVKMMQVEPLHAHFNHTGGWKRTVLTLLFPTICGGWTLYLVLVFICNGWLLPVTPLTVIPHFTISWSIGIVLSQIVEYSIILKCIED